MLDIRPQAIIETWIKDNNCNNLSLRSIRRSCEKNKRRCSPLNFGSVEPGSGLRKGKKTAGKGQKRKKKICERNEPWSKARTLVNFIQNTKSTRLVRGEQGSKRVKLNIKTTHQR